MFFLGWHIHSICTGFFFSVVFLGGSVDDVDDDAGENAGEDDDDDEDEDDEGDDEEDDEEDDDDDDDTILRFLLLWNI